MKDRGQSAFGCTQTEIVSGWNNGNNAETRANRFASDLLLPKRLFQPLAKDRPINLATIHQLAVVFRMSLTATAIRLVELGSFPTMLIYCVAGEKKWFKTTPGLPSVLWPPTRVPDGTVMHRVLSGTAGKEAEDDIRADRWFEHPQSGRYYIRESCFTTADSAAITVLWWEDEKQLIDIEEEEERRAARRSDFREEE